MLLFGYLDRDTSSLHASHMKGYSMCVRVWQAAPGSPCFSLEGRNLPHHVWQALLGGRRTTGSDWHKRMACPDALTHVIDAPVSISQNSSHIQDIGIVVHPNFVLWFETLLSFCTRLQTQWQCSCRAIQQMRANFCGNIVTWYARTTYMSVSVKYGVE